MTKREYLDDQDAEEPDDFVISLTSQVNSHPQSFVLINQTLGQYHFKHSICSTYS